jgi:hypothetical protein
VVQQSVIQEQYHALLSLRRLDQSQNRALKVVNGCLFPITAFFVKIKLAQRLAQPVPRQM